MKFTLVGLMMIFSSFAIRAQNCNSIILMQYDTTSYSSQSYKSHDLAITFNSGFDDSIAVFINDKQVSKDFYKTDISCECTNHAFHIKSIKASNPNVLEIKNLSSGTCVKIVLDYRYNLLRINKSIYKNDDADWFMLYTNRIIKSE